MEIEGKVIIDLPLQSGTSKAGNPWKKKEWVIETQGNYPKRVKIQAFNANVDNIRLEMGKDYRLSVDLESREFNGRWYTDVSVYRSEEIMQQPQQGYQQPAYGGDVQGAYSQPQGGFPQGAPQSFGAPAATPFDSAPANSDEDLPF